MSNLRQAIGQKYIHIKMNVYKNIYKSLTYKNSLIYFKKQHFIQIELHIIKFAKLEAY